MSEGNSYRQILRSSSIIGGASVINILVGLLRMKVAALLLAAPVRLAMLALAPWVIRLLYSAAFVEAVEVLRWQVLGDLLKIASWPLGFVLLASGAGKIYMATEWLAMATFVALSVLLLPVMGIAATGASFLGMYVIYLALVWTLAARRTAFTWTGAVKKHAVLIFASGLAIHALAWVSEWAAAGAGVFLAAAWGVFALVRLTHAGGLSGPVGKLAGVARAAMMKMGVWRE